MSGWASGRGHGHRRARGASGARAATVGAVVLTLLGGAGCTSDGGSEGGGGKKGAENLAPLEKRWDVPTRLTSQTVSDQPFTVSKGVLTVSDRARTLKGYNARTGEPRWTVRLPKGTTGVCDFSSDSTSAGLVGVTLGVPSEGGEGDELSEANQVDCRYLGVLDTRRGELRWTEDMAAEVTGGDSEHRSAVTITDRALKVPVAGGEIRQYRPEDGKRLTTVDRLQPTEESLDHRGRTADFDQRHIAAGQTLTKTDPKERRPSHISLYRTAREKPLWRKRVREPGTQVHRIVAEKPLTLETSENGHRTIRTYDAQGNPKRTIGKAVSAKSPEYDTAPFSAGRTLFVSYSTDSSSPSGSSNEGPLYAYDLDTGEVRWSKRMESTKVVGVKGERLLVLFRGSNDERPELLSYDIGDGSEHGLGTLPLRHASTLWKSGQSSIHGDLLYAPEEGASKGRERLVAYRLPQRGQKREDGGERPPPPRPRQDPYWRKADLRPREVERTCEAVSPAARKAAQVYRADLPPPAGCRWEEQYAPDGVQRVLAVTVTAHAPFKDETDRYPESAKERAQEFLQDAEKRRDPGSGDGNTGLVDEFPLAGAEKLSGFGDEALARTKNLRTSRAKRSSVLVRHRNVTVEVYLSHYAGADDSDAALPSERRIEHAARGATADVLKEIGAPAPNPAAHTK